MTEEMNQIDVQVPEVGDVVKGIVSKVEDKHVNVDIVNVKQPRSSQSVNYQVFTLKKHQMS